MPDQPKKLFDLLDIETEPTDEQLAELMQFVVESVREKRIVGQKALQKQMMEALSEPRVAQLLQK